MTETNRVLHDELVVSVHRILQLHADLAIAKPPDTQTHLQREIAATDRAIDELVYRLYELTPAEIALVEAAAAPRSAPRPDNVGEATMVDVPPLGASVQAEATAAHHYFVKEESPKEGAAS